MRHLLIAGSAVLMLAACADQEPQEQPAAPGPGEGELVIDAMPPEFQGAWDFAEQDCAADASEMRLVIEARSVSYYESGADLLSIEQTGDRTLTARHSFSGEGEQWEETLGYELSDDGERLTVTTADGSFSTRIRCRGE